MFATAGASLVFLVVWLWLCGNVAMLLCLYTDCVCCADADDDELKI